jgi:hypothetical protein
VSAKLIGARAPDKRPTWTVSQHTTISRPLYAYIVAPAIREGKNTAGVIADILKAESKRQ